MRISDWSSDVCSSDLSCRAAAAGERRASQWRAAFSATSSPTMMTITIATIVGAAVTATGDATDARRRALRPISWLTGVQMRFFTVSASAALLMLGTAAASAQTAQTAPDADDDAQEERKSN